MTDDPTEVPTEDPRPKDLRRAPSVVLVNTGNGKGKSSSAFGMAIRSIGWGMRVAILQYVKGKWETGERTFFEAQLATALPMARLLYWT